MPYGSLLLWLLSPFTRVRIKFSVELTVLELRLNTILIVYNFKEDPNVHGYKEFKF